ncbi:MAG: cytochrome c4 [Methylococcaceae bacterium]|nr:cytochrome c4 [Methylococcaceae bacterium]
MNAQKQFLSALFLMLICVIAKPVSAAAAWMGEQKSSVCTGCHGPNGKSSNPQRPNLAAQQSEYLINQMNAYKSGKRNNPMMQSMAINLKASDIENLAEYYANMPPVSSGGEPTLAKAGQTKASMCLGCHGPSAEGNGQIPRLAGQHPSYLERQLNYFKTGVRKNSHMEAISANLTDADIRELAAYFGSL